MNEEELKDGELIATAEPITTDDIDNAILNPEPNKIQSIMASFHLHLVRSMDIALSIYQYKIMKTDVRRI